MATRSTSSTLTNLYLNHTKLMIIHTIKNMMRRRTNPVADAITNTAAAAASHLIIYFSYCSITPGGKRPAAEQEQPNSSDLARLSKVSDSFHVMLGMNPHPSVVNFNRLLSSVVKMRHYSLALYMFDAMRERDIPLDECTLNISINCYNRLFRVDVGMAVFALFYKYGLPPNVTTFNTLLRGQFLSNKVPQAEELFQKLHIDCKPNKFTYRIIINGLCKTGYTRTAHELLVWLEQENGCKPDLCSYNTVIGSWCRHRRVDDALELFSRMSHRGISPDVDTYRLIIVCLYSLGRRVEGSELLDEMPFSSKGWW